MPKTKNYTETEFMEAVETSKSIAEVCRKIGIKPLGGNYGTVNRKIEKLGLDTSHFTGQAWNQGANYRPINPFPQLIPLSDILVADSTYKSYRLKERLIKEGYKEHKCEVCGNTEWNGVPIPLELHHLDGNHQNNLLENLQILCSNCHAQTENYRRKKDVQVLELVDNSDLKFDGQ